MFGFSNLKRLQRCAESKLLQYYPCEHTEFEVPIHDGKHTIRSIFCTQFASTTASAAPPQTADNTAANGGVITGCANHSTTHPPPQPEPQPQENEQDGLTVAREAAKRASDGATPTPLVLIHGMGSGLALWLRNIDAFVSEGRPVFAFDMLGFGGSSRNFQVPSSTDAVEELILRSIEEWRLAIGLHTKFVLLCHSLGCYYGSAYALCYPENVKNLILVDPWGFKEMPVNPYERFSYPNVARLFNRIMSNMNPLSALRAVGPLGLPLMRRVRGDIGRYFYPLNDLPVDPHMRTHTRSHSHSQSHSNIPIATANTADYSSSCDKNSNVMDDEFAAADALTNSNKASAANADVNVTSDKLNEQKQSASDKKKDFPKSVSLHDDQLDSQNIQHKKELVFQYLYYCNAQKPTGEQAFRVLCGEVAYANNPMLKRIIHLEESIPINFVFGQRSWVDSETGYQVKLLRPNSRVYIRIIEAAGHHVYAQAYDKFNAYILKVLREIDATPLPCDSIHTPAIPASAFASSGNPLEATMSMSSTGSISTPPINTDDTTEEEE